MQVVLGEFDTSMEGETAGRQEVGVVAAFYHKQFDYDTFNNDIALVQLEQAVDLSLHTPVCLPEQRMDEDGAAVWVTGEVVFTQSRTLSPCPRCRLGGAGGKFLENSKQTSGA